MILYLATNNAHKVEEFARALAPVRLQSAREIGGMPEVPEDTNTFAGNAFQKARALFEKTPDSAWVVADDSGLAVDALDGAPGVTSARYAGIGASDEANLWKLLQSMESVPEGKRQARFVCTLALVGPFGEEMTFSGDCPGRIAFSPAGNAGFGYDPIFIPDGYEQTLGQLGSAIKDKISHRAAAIRKFRHWLDSQ